MPELSRFYGIVVKMIYNDTGKHNEPHFHVYSGEYSATITLDGELLAGQLSTNDLKLVQAWAIIHKDELRIAWDNAVKSKPIGKIEPLK